MPIVTQFKSAFPSGQYALKDGTAAVFMNHTYRTTNKTYIEELKKAIEDGHPQITGGDTIDTAVDNPLAGLEAMFRAKFLAEQAAQNRAAIDPSNDMGGNKNINDNFGALTSDGGLLNIATVGDGDNAPKIVPVVKAGAK